MKILGIDPGLSQFGYAVLDFDEKGEIELICAGDIISKKGEQKRLLKIFQTLSDILSTYAPEICIIEKVFININKLSSLNLGQARGVAILCCEIANKLYLEIGATSVKKNILGNGRASKSEIQTYVFNRFHIKLRANACDAIIIALCYSNLKEKIAII